VNFQRHREHHPHRTPPLFASKMKNRHGDSTSHSSNKVNRFPRVLYRSNRPARSGRRAPSPEQNRKADRRSSGETHGKPSPHNGNLAFPAAAAQWHVRTTLPTPQTVPSYPPFVLPIRNSHRRLLPPAVGAGLQPGDRSSKSAHQVDSRRNRLRLDWGFTLPIGRGISMAAPIQVAGGENLFALFFELGGLREYINDRSRLVSAIKRGRSCSHAAVNLSPGPRPVSACRTTASARICPSWHTSRTTELPAAHFLTPCNNLQRVHTGAVHG
jgi:hypothetical protein